MIRSHRRLAPIAALCAICSVGVAVIGGTAATGPAPAAAAPSPEELAAQLVANDSALRQGIDAWRAAGDPPTSPPPAEVMAEARSLQTTVRLLAKRAGLAKRTIAALPGPLAREVRDLTAAARKLRRLSRGARQRRLKTGEPPPLAELVDHYGAARRRHGIGPRYLAAIHHVETKFGRVKSKSVSGAKGPMQFIPSTWRIHGRGGNIHDPRDAILAAGRLLRHSGAPRSYGRALYAYNPSKLYVGAVQLYAGLIARDPYALYILYCWGP